MAAMIRRISRLPLLNSSLVNIRTCCATATPTRTKAAGSGLGLPCSFAPNLLAQRSDNCRALTTAVFNQNASYSTINVASSGNDDNHQPYIQIYTHQQRREFSSRPTDNRNRPGGVRFSTLLSKHLGLSRRQAERMILTERVTFFGKIMNNPAFELFPSTDPNQDSSTAMKVDGKLVKGVMRTLEKLHLEEEKNGTDDTNANENDTKAEKQKKAMENIDYSNTRIWLANKLKGELITEDDPVGRPSMLQRLSRGGVGKSSKKNEPPTHLKPVGRLDMMTEGLMIFTNDGKYARQLELPTSQLWRTYRVRVHGRLSMGKLRAMRNGLTVRVNDNPGGMDRNPSGEVVQTGKMMKYKGIKVSIERKNTYQGSGRSGGTNTWLQITCAEGKNRQLRRILGALGLDVTRLVRISYGDYDLNTIPPGRAIEVNYKDLEGMKKKGPLFVKSHKEKKKEVDKEKTGAGVQWINHS
mmetsp:Transcript_17612/g.38102  ORF Transcript_17612/g.38102 Transcript_17612/m.38102 type:complete len:468 (-) Transcript_17612:39-1442(-)